MGGGGDGGGEERLEPCVYLPKQANLAVTPWDRSSSHHWDSSAPHHCSSLMYHRNLPRCLGLDSLVSTMFSIDTHFDVINTTVWVQLGLFNYSTYYKSIPNKKSTATTTLTTTTTTAATTTTTKT
ncbi:hypothetical protein PoB_004692600 [Plakobranchus ocellatus]|uniref:Uncharacterized protein n=1 Tax=Plakobranchus ocellatus TaxID=259542 RepID=A0AAV4BJ38_9GAST|nr:hypothetical protein PoB_004692600 [Plakobranchus ocellatus]